MKQLHNTMSRKYSKIIVCEQSNRKKSSLSNVCMHQKIKKKKEGRWYLRKEKKCFQGTVVSLYLCYGFKASYNRVKKQKKKTQNTEYRIQNTSFSYIHCIVVVVSYLLFLLLLRFMSDVDHISSYFHENSIILCASGVI